MIDEEDPNFIHSLREACQLTSIEVKRKAFAAGIPVVYEKNGWIVREYADGTRENMRPFKVKEVI